MMSQTSGHADYCSSFDLPRKEDTPAHFSERLGYAVIADSPGKCQACGGESIASAGNGVDFDCGRDRGATFCRQAGVRCDDDDEEDRHRRDRGGGSELEVGGPTARCNGRRYVQPLMLRVGRGRA